MRKVAITLAALALAGCGGNDGDSGGDVGNTGPPTGPAPTGTVETQTDTGSDSDGY